MLLLLQISFCFVMRKTLDTNQNDVIITFLTPPTTIKMTYLILIILILNKC